MFVVQPLLPTCKCLSSLLLSLSGVHIIQRMNGCEWDDKTGEIKGFNQYGYNGDDFITFDWKTLTWVAPAKGAVNMKYKWNEDSAIQFWKNALTYECTNLLKMYVTYGNSSLQSTGRVTQHDVVEHR